jgi:hypothetical protein
VGKSGRARTLTGAELADQRAVLLTLLEDYAQLADGSIRYGAWSRAARWYGLDVHALRHAWAGRAVTPETLEQWRAIGAAAVEVSGRPLTPG